MIRLRNSDDVLEELSESSNAFYDWLRGEVDAQAEPESKRAVLLKIADGIHKGELSVLNIAPEFDTAFKINAVALKLYRLGFTQDAIEVFTKNPSSSNAVVRTVEVKIMAKELADRKSHTEALQTLRISEDTIVAGLQDPAIEAADAEMLEELRTEIATMRETIQKATNNEVGN